MKLTSDFANTSEAIRIGDCFLFDRFAKTSSPCNFRLLQQYLHKPADQLRPLSGLLCEANQTFPRMTLKAEARAWKTQL